MFDNSVTEYKFKIGQHVYFQPKRAGRSPVDAVHGPYQIIKRLPAADDGEYQFEIRSAVEGHNRVATESKLGALRLMALMLNTARDLHHFGTSHFISKPHPGLSHAKPKGLISVSFRGACHRYTLLNQMLVNSNFHCTSIVHTAANNDSGVRQRFDP